jgi:cytochrome P450
MPNGVKLPCGTHIAVDSSQMWNPNVYENPETFDGFRFLRIRQAGGKSSNAASLVSTSPEHIAFGMGKPICPGRFFAANESKIALADMLLNYEVRLQHGYEPKMVELGFEMLADPEPRVEVRRRQ